MSASIEVERTFSIHSILYIEPNILMRPMLHRFVGGSFKTQTPDTRLRAKDDADNDDDNAKITALLLQT